MKVGYRVSVLFFLALVVAAPAGAQTFRGTVLDDSTKRPLEAATLALLDASGKDLGRPPVRSDSLGRFVLHAGTTGRYAVRVSRIGYAPLTSATIELVGGGVAVLNLTMSAVQQKLGAIVVTERRRLTRFELYSDLGFQLRRSGNVGKFLDTLDLQPYKKGSMIDLLANHGVGVQFVPSSGGRRPGNPDSLVMINGMNPNATIRTCAPELWIDGFQELRGQHRLMGMSADAIYGVEVFGPAQLPSTSTGADLGAEQASLPRASRCGVIAIWTKGYINEMKAKEAKRAAPPSAFPERLSRE